MKRVLALCLWLLPGAAAAQDDRDYLTAFLEDNLSGAGRVVVVTGFAGALSSQATVQELTIADDTGVWLTLRDVSLDWNRAALFSGAVSINTLRAGEIVLERMPMAEAGLPSAGASSFALPDLPVSVEIGALVAEKISLGQAVLGTAVEGRLEAALSLIGGEGRADLLLERTDNGPAGRLALAASYANTGQQLVIDLEAREEAGGIAAGVLGLPGAPSVALTVQGDGPLADFVAAIGLQTDGVSRLAGEVRLTGNDAGEQGFIADLSGDLAPLFLPDYAAFFGPAVALHAKGQRFADGRMALSDLEVTAQALDLRGTVALAADGLPERIAVTGRIGLEGQPVLLPLTTDLETRIGSADIAITYDAQVGETWGLQASVLGLERQDFTAEKLELLGSGKIGRAASARRFDMVMTFAAGGLAPADQAMAAALGTSLAGKASVIWTEGDGVVTVPQLTLNGADYGVVAAGRIAGLSDALSLTGTLKAEVEDAARFAGLAGRPLGGAAVLDVQGSGSPLSGAFDLAGRAGGRNMRMGMAEVDNLLRGQAEIGFSVLRTTEGTELRRLNINAATLAVEAKGRIGAAGSALEAQVRFEDIGVLGAEYRGALTGKAGFTGSPTAGRLTLDATGRGLGIGMAEVDGLLAGDSLLTLDLGLEGAALRVNTATLANPQVQAKATGVWQATDSDLQAEIALADLAVLGAGYRGTLAGNASFTGSPSLGRVSFEATGKGLGLGVAEVDRLLAGTSAVSGKLMLRGGMVQVEAAELRNPQLEARASGTLQGTSQSVEITAGLKNLGLLLPEFPGALQVRGRAVQDAGGTTLDLAGTGPGRIEATVKGKIAPGFGRADLAIRGTAQAALANAFIAPRAISGGLGFDLRLNGPLQAKSLAGTVTLADGRLADPGQNFALQAIAARADLAGGRANISAKAAVSTGGGISVAGGIGLTAPYPADLAVDIQRVTLRDPDLYETTANGALTVTGPLAGGALIAGRVALAETELRVPSTGFGSAGDLPGLQHRNETAAQRATRARAGLLEAGNSQNATAAPYRLDVTISAPNRVFLRGRGLDAELGGELLLRGTTWAVQPGGALSLIRGRLDILGKRLDLDEAVLQMEGELVPYLRIVASTENDDITSSVVIDGPADNPVVSFQSQPELPQEEVLAQLLFGQTLQNLSALQAVQLAGAVRTLAGKGGDGLVAKLRRGIGLDNLDVKTASDGTSSVTAGKYLTEKIYSEVTVDQNGKSQINLNLDLRKHITLRGRASSDGTTGFGILLEKDY